jgi:hypothetical protein
MPCRFGDKLVIVLAQSDFVHLTGFSQFLKANWIFHLIRPLLGSEDSVESM